MKKVICSEKAPGAIGPYSQAIEANGMVFVSGQLPIDAATGQMAEGIEGQARQSLENIKHILEEAGLTMGNIVKTTVFLQDMSLFAVDDMCLPLAPKMELKRVADDKLQFHMYDDIDGFPEWKASQLNKLPA